MAHLMRQKQQEIADRPPPKPQKIATGEPVTVECELPDYFREVLKKLIPLEDA